jgi:signal transduction histidine kinase
MTKPVWKVCPPLIFGVIVASFLTATGFGQWRMRVLDGALVDIASTTAPSIEYLAAARSDLRNLQTVCQERLSDLHGPPGIPPDAALPRMATIENARRTLDDAVKGYLALPVAPNEHDLWREILAAKETIDRLTVRFELGIARGDAAGASTRLNGEIATAAADLDAAITSAIELNAARSRTLAEGIQGLRTSGLYAAVGLDILCTVIGVCGMLLLRHVIREHDALLERHRLIEHERASELEQFAGRVAHDILSPLSTVGLALELARKPTKESERTRFLDRGTAALTRVKRIVNGLLDFARAGANRDPDGQADVGDVITDLAFELEPTAAAAGVTLEVAPAATGATVACNPGVLTSLVANLARNAIKYIGDGPVKRVEIRSLDRGALVRFEVEDTGPGLPPDIEHRVFDAYARSRMTTQPGIGLGLSTVKRLAEAHGGRVGVVSVTGKGCTFWFELPKPMPTVPLSAQQRSEALA